MDLKDLTPYSGRLDTFRFGQMDIIEIENPENLSIKECLLRHLRNHGKFYSLVAEANITFRGDMKDFKYLEEGLIQVQDWKEFICEEFHFWSNHVYSSSNFKPLPYEECKTDIENSMKVFLNFFEKRKVSEAYFIDSSGLCPQWNEYDFSHELYLKTEKIIYVFTGNDSY